MPRVAMLVLGFVLVIDAGAATAAGRKCLDVTGNYRCPSGLEIYMYFSQGGGGFVYDVEYDDGRYYQYIADDKFNDDAEGGYIASCRRKSFRTVFPVAGEDKEKYKGKDHYEVEEYTLDHRRDLVVNIYIVEAPGGNMNNAKSLEHKEYFTCKKM